MNEIKTKVKDIMTSDDVVTLNSEDTFEHAAKLFIEHNFNGFPVVVQNQSLVGIVTAFEMVTQSANFLKNSQSVDIESGLKQIKIKDIMNRDPLVVNSEIEIENLAKEFAEHHRVNPIPVVDGNNKLLGVVSRFDIIKFLGDKYFNPSVGEHKGVLKRLGRLDVID